MSKIKKPIYGPPELDEAQMTPEQINEAKRKEILHKIRERRIKKAFKAFRFRSLKNFLFWVFGVLSSVAIILGSIFVGVKVIPVNTYLKWAGQDSSEYVSEKIASKSIIDAIFGIQDYTFEDVPVIEKMVSDLLAETGIDDFVIVDYDALKNVKFANADEGSDLIDEVSKCIKLNTTAKMFKDIKAFNEYCTVQAPIEIKEGEESWSLKEGLNADLYCYESVAASGGSPMNSLYSGTEPVYEPVFVDGALNPKLASLNKEQMEKVVFYIKPVCELSALDVFNNIGEIMSNVQLSDMLSIVGASKAGGIVGKILEGQTIGSLTGDNFDESSLLSNINIGDIGGVELLGQLGDLILYVGYMEVPNESIPELDEDEKIITDSDTEEFLYDPTIYYYLNGEDYLPAFDEQTGKWQGDGEYSDTQLYYKTGWELVDKRPTLVDEDGKKVIEKDESGEFKFNPALYYYVSDGKNEMIDESYVSAFDRETGEWIVDKDYNEVTLYYANINCVKFDVVIEIIGDSIGRKQITDLLTNFGADFGTDSIISNILGDKTVDQVGDIKPENIYLKDVLKDANQELKDILAQTIIDDNGNSVKYVNITLDMLSNFDTDSLKLTTVLTYNDDNGTPDNPCDDVKKNEQLYNILLDALVDEDGDPLYTNPEDITVGGLSSFSVDGISLTTVLTPNANNQKLYDVLKDVTGETDINKIKVGSLSTFNTDSIKLSTVLPYYDESASSKIDNKELYKILLEATGTDISKMDETEIENASKTLTVGAINNFDISKVRLATAITNANEKLINVLSQTVKDKDGNSVAYENITIGMLSNFDTDTLSLTTVLPYKDTQKNIDNSKLYKILLEATGTDISKMDEMEIENASITLTVGAINNFDISKVRLVTAMVADENGSYGNNILDALLTGENKNSVTIGNVGEKIGSVSLYDAYGQNCFTKIKSESIDKNQTDDDKVRKFIFIEEQDAFVHITNQQIEDQNIAQDDIYYIHEDDGIWLLLCFTSEGYEDSDGYVYDESTGQNVLGRVDTDGRPEKYVISKSTISSLENVSIFKTLFERTTVRQFVDSGIVDDGEDGFAEEMYILNIDGVLKKLDGILSAGN